MRGKNLFSILVDLQICQSWCHEILVTAPEIMRGKNFRNCKNRSWGSDVYKSISQFLTGAMKSWSQHQKLQEEEAFFCVFTIYALVYASVWCHDILVMAPEIARGVPLQVYINIYVFIWILKSVHQSSTELAHVGYIYIKCFVYFSLCCFYIMFLLSWVRSLGRCF